jgi:hypothetical protein
MAHELESQDEASIRKAVFLERAKEQCKMLFTGEQTKTDFEKHLLTLWKCYKSPMERWATRIYKGE